MNEIISRITLPSAIKNACWKLLKIIAAIYLVLLITKITTHYFAGEVNAAGEQVYSARTQAIIRLGIVLVSGLIARRLFFPKTGASHAASTSEHGGGSWSIQTLLLAVLLVAIILGIMLWSASSIHEMLPETRASREREAALILAQMHSVAAPPVYTEPIRMGIWEIAIAKGEWGPWIDFMADRQTHVDHSDGMVERQLGRRRGVDYERIGDPITLTPTDNSTVPPGMSARYRALDKLVTLKVTRTW